MAREGKAGAGGKGRAVVPGDIAVKGGRQRAERNKERRRPRRDRRRRQRQREERLRQGVVAENSASVYLAIAVGEEGDGHAVDERGVNGDRITVGEVRRSNVTLPERVKAAASVLSLSNGTGT